MAEIRKKGTYSAETEDPLYPFGYGLSYTQFGYSDLKIDPESVSSEDCVRIQATIKNLGDRAGDEVVQLYIRDVESSVPRPVKKLEGFSRISLQPDETRTVEFSVPSKQLAFWDVDRDTWVVDPGEFEVMVGRSSEDIELTCRFVVR
jgi:beta-glucosidase